MDFITIKTKSGTELEIHTDYWQKPMPIRDCDWCATLRDQEDDGPAGWGRTEKEAIDSLLDTLEEEEADDEYEIYAENERLAGLTPMTRDQWQWLDELRREREDKREWRSDDIADGF